MISEAARQELKAMAASSRLRKEFERLSASSAMPKGQRADLDRVLDFLTTMSQIFPRPAAPSSPIPSPRFRL